jgi:PEP-CTERM motif
MNLDFTIRNGQITVTGSAVPEPSTIVMAATAVLLGLSFFRRSRLSPQGAVEPVKTHAEFRSERRSD